jgi:hypothetical protein
MVPMVNMILNEIYDVPPGMERVILDTGSYVINDNNAYIIAAY